MAWRVTFGSSDNLDRRSVFEREAVDAGSGHGIAVAQAGEYGNFCEVGGADMDGGANQIAVHNAEDVWVAVFAMQGLAGNGEDVGLAGSGHGNGNVRVGKEAVIGVVDGDEDFADIAGVFDHDGRGKLHDVAVPFLADAGIPDNADLLADSEAADFGFVEKSPNANMVEIGHLKEELAFLDEVALVHRDGIDGAVGGRAKTGVLQDGAGCGQIGLSVSDGGIGASQFDGRVARGLTAFVGSERVLGEGNSLSGGGYFAGRGSAGGLEFLEGVEFALSLFEIEAGAGGAGGKGLAFFLGSALAGGFVGGLGGAKGAFSGGNAGSGGDVIQLHEELARGDVVPLLNIDLANGGSQRTAVFEVLFGFDKAIGADGGDESIAGGSRGMDRQLLAGEGASHEKHDSEKYGRAEPEPHASYLLSFLCHSFVTP